MPASTANTRNKAPNRSDLEAAAYPKHETRNSIASESRTSGAYHPTSLKLPVALKVQIDDVARAAGLSPHAYMLQTLSASTERARMREQFQREAQAALSEMKASGLGHELGDVRDHFAKLSAFRSGKGRKPRKMVATKIT